MKTTTHKGSDLSNGFKSYARKCRKTMSEAFNSLGGQVTKFNIGFYYWSGFGVINGQTYYFSISDVRYNLANNNILFRTAKNDTDYTGGQNQYLNKSLPLAGQIRAIIEKRIMFVSL